MSNATTPVRSLREIALATGTDKEGAHHYTAHYERHLQHLREAPIKLLEIGIGGHIDPALAGASLRMWKEFFPNARIFGLDIVDHAGLADERVTILTGSQADRDFLHRVVAEHGPFDVIIDDGSHHCRHIEITFQELFPALAADGIYVIEDLQTSYWASYEGSSEADRTGTSMTLLHALADGLNYAEFDIPGYVPSYTDQWVTGISFYHNLAFIQKGRNDEVSHMLPPHPRDRRYFGTAAPRRGAAPTAIRRPLWRRVVRRLVPSSIRTALRKAGPRG